MYMLHALPVVGNDPTLAYLSRLACEQPPLKTVIDAANILDDENMLFAFVCVQNYVEASECFWDISPVSSPARD
jgi:hypothetical protein